MAKLVLLSAGLAGRSYELKVEKTTIGRVEDNTFPIAEPSVSLQAAANVSALTTAHETRQIETAVGTGGWQDEFTQSLAHVVVLGSDNVQFRMHPAELGPVDIAINVAGGPPQCEKPNAVAQGVSYARESQRAR